MKYTLLLIILSVFCVSSFAQITIRGIVLDENGKPIANASVFFNNTQIGTKTNENGNFMLYSNAIQREIVISCIGYEPIKISNLDNGKRYKISMVEFKNNLNEVVIGSKIKNKVKWNAIFFRLLMGSDIHSYYESKILNPEVINFYFNGATKILTVTNSAPIEISHPRLGYIIKVDLIKFEYDMINEILNRENSVFYEEKYKNAQRNNIQLATNWSYYGSKRHFYTALALNNLANEGFEIYNYHSIENLEKKRVSNKINELKLKHILNGFDQISISLGDLIKNKDSAQYYLQVLRQQDYLSRIFTKVAVDSIVKFNADSTASLLFQDTLMVIYNRTLATQKKYAKIERPDYHVKLESFFIRKDQKPIAVKVNGQMMGDPILVIGDMAKRGLADELPYDIDPRLPRFKEENKLFRSQ